MIKIQNFIFKVKHLPGDKNILLDILSKIQLIKVATTKIKSFKNIGVLLNKAYSFEHWGATCMYKYL